MPQWYRIARDVLDDVEVAFGDRRYRASIQRDRVVVLGSLGRAAGTRVADAEIRIWGGTAVGRYVRGEDVPSHELDHLLAAGLIVSSLIGNPRKPRAQQAPRFMWSDHVALAKGDDPERALRYSDVQDPVADHTRDALGRIVVFVRGRQTWPRPGKSPVAPPPTPAAGEPPAPADLDGLFRTSYERLSERPEAIRRDPFPFDPDARDRASLEHRKIQNRLDAIARSNGCEVSRPEPLDIVWRKGSSVTLVEVKTINAQNEAKQLRLGLGQVLDYQDTLGRSGIKVPAVLALSSKPLDLRWVDLCAAHGVSLVWRENFRKLFADT